MYARLSSSSAPSFDAQLSAAVERLDPVVDRAENGEHRAERIQRVAFDLGGSDLAGDPNGLFARRA